MTNITPIKSGVHEAQTGEEWEVTLTPGKIYIVKNNRRRCTLRYAFENGAPVLRDIHVEYQLTATEIGRLKRSALARLTAFLHTPK